MFIPGILDVFSVQMGSFSSFIQILNPTCDVGWPQAEIFSLRCGPGGAQDLGPGGGRIPDTQEAPKFRVYPLPETVLIIFS